MNWKKFIVKSTARTPFLNVLAVFIAIAVLSGGCAKAPTVPSSGKILRPRDAAEAWEFYHTRAAHLSAALPEAFTAEATLNYGRGRKSNRLRLKFWGNTPHPVRLDVEAGFNTIVAAWHEDARNLTVFYPDRYHAEIRPTGRQALARLGFALPFSLSDLAALAIAGPGVTEIVPPHYSQAQPLAKDGGWRYSFLGDDENRTESVTLDSQGRLTEWQGSGRSAWQVRFSRFETPEGGGTDLPALVKMNRGDERAVLRIKSISLRPEVWEPQALDLTLPSGTTVGNGLTVTTVP